MIFCWGTPETILLVGIPVTIVWMAVWAQTLFVAAPVTMSSGTTILRTRVPVLEIATMSVGSNRVRMSCT